MLQTKVINNEDINNLITYEFKENDKLACVTFNCEIPFGISDRSKVTLCTITIISKHTTKTSC